MRKKAKLSKLSFDKSTVANLNTQDVTGGGAATYEATFCFYCNTKNSCGTLTTTLVPYSFQGSCA